MYEDFLPERLAKLRTAKGVSARKMSIELRQANNYINNIENKKTFPSMQAFFDICQYFHITPKEFFDEGNPYPDYLRALIEDLKKLDAAQLESVAGMVKQLNRRN